MRIEGILAEDDRGVVRLTFTGTHRGAFRDLPPTGRTIRFGAIRIYRLVDGLLAQLRG